MKRATVILRDGANGPFVGHADVDHGLVTGIGQFSKVGEPVERSWPLHRISEIRWHEPAEVTS